MSALENIFDAPIPGQSLTDTPGNSPWEHPPQFAKVEDAAEYIWDRLHSEEMLDQVITLLRNNVPVEALARMILFGGFAEGKWSPDVAILLSEIVLKQIMAIGIKAEIPKMKIFIADQSNNKFHEEFAKFKVQNKTTSSVGQEKKEKFLEEIRDELKSKKPSGIMTKETE
tara:strand:+ start:519 stop:1028 length:510 start_codon:yes stop_codon:yes gene_type:complete